MTTPVQTLAQHAAAAQAAIQAQRDAAARVAQEAAAARAASQQGQPGAPGAAPQGQAQGG